MAERLLAALCVATTVTLFSGCSPSSAPTQGAASAPAPVASSASSSKAFSMERYEGTPIQTTLGYGIVLNKDSSLKREWFVITDPQSPVAIVGAAGVNVAYQAGERYSSGEYQYRASYKLAIKEPVTAIEVRVQLFDVFGEHVRTLSAANVADANGELHQNGTWRVLSETEAATAYTSVTYISQVRTAAGKVYTIDSDRLLDQLKKVTAKITEKDIAPKKDPK